MENQHRKIEGYRELSDKEIEAMNSIKELAGAVGILVEECEASEALDARWVAIAKTTLQTGFMQLVRSVAQPTTF